MPNHFKASGEDRPYFIFDTLATATSTQLSVCGVLSIRLPSKPKLSYHFAFLHCHLNVSGAISHMSVGGALAPEPLLK